MTDFEILSDEVAKMCKDQKLKNAKPILSGPKKQMGKKIDYEFALLGNGVDLNNILDNALRTYRENDKVIQYQESKKFLMTQKKEIKGKISKSKKNNLDENQVKQLNDSILELDKQMKECDNIIETNKNMKIIYAGEASNILKKGGNAARILSQMIKKKL